MYLKFTIPVTTEINFIIDEIMNIITDRNREEKYADTKFAHLIKFV